MFDQFDMFRLGLTNEDKQFYERDKISINKKLASIQKRCREASRNSTCYTCGSFCTSFCNSHSVPKFCLQNIAVNGFVYYSNTFIDYPMLNNQKGVNEAGTFHIICRNCDSKLFSNYENPDNYSRIPNDKMLAEIAMKNYLRSISKRQLEIQLYKEIEKMSGQDVSQMQKVNELDLCDYTKGFEYAKKATQKKWDDNYYLFCYEKLDYVVPMAYQNNVALISDLEGRIINNIYDISANYHIANIHVCVFPLKEHSVIIMFIRDGEKRLRRFCKQFKKLDLNKKLEVINYIVFSYSEDVFFYKGIDRSILENQELEKVSKQTTVAVMNNPSINAIERAARAFDLNKCDTIPNLLKRDNRVR